MSNPHKRLWTFTDVTAAPHPVTRYPGPDFTQITGPNGFTGVHTFANKLLTDLMVSGVEFNMF